MPRYKLPCPSSIIDFTLICRSADFFPSLSRYMEFFSVYVSNLCVFSSYLVNPPSVPIHTVPSVEVYNVYIVRYESPSINKVLKLLVFISKRAKPLRVPNHNILLLSSVMLNTVLFGNMPGEKAVERKLWKSYPSHDFSPEFVPSHIRPPWSNIIQRHSSAGDKWMVFTNRYGRFCDTVVRT